MRQLGTQPSLVIALAISALAFGAVAPPLLAHGPAHNPTNDRQQGSAQPSASQQSLQPISCTVDVSPKKFSPAITEALHLYRTGKFDEAAAAYTAVIASVPAKPDLVLAYTGLARVYLKQKKVDEAFTAATKAVALTPGKTPAITALGEVYFRQGKMKEAEDSFLNPQRACDIDARSYLGMARLFRATTNYKSEKTALDQAIKIDADDPDIQRAYMSTLNRADLLKFLRAYLSRETDDDPEHRSSLQHELELMEDAGREHRPDCRLTSKVTATQTRMESLLTDPTHIRGYGLRVKINGAPATLMLDTGAGGIVIDKKVADKAGLKKIAESDMLGIGDKAAPGGYYAFADSIQVGDLQFEHCYVDVVNRNSVLDDQGLIGADVFDDFLVDIDLANGKFKLSQLPPYPGKATPQEATLESQPAVEFHAHDRYVAPEMKQYTPVFRFGHILLIPTSVNNSPSMLFLIDTGAFDNSITPRAARQVTKISRDDEDRVKGLNGEVKDVYTAAKANLRFAHLKQDRQGLVTFSLDGLSNSIGAEASGTLGFGMLLMLDVKIDYRDALVSLTYTAPGSRH